MTANAKKAIKIGSMCFMAYLAVYLARNILSTVTPAMQAQGFTKDSIGLASSIYFYTYAVGQLIFFAVPLVIVGFIAPAIARLGQNASKMLLTAVALAYFSSVGAAFFSAFSGYAIIPHLSIPTTAEGLVALPKPSFVLNIPP